MNSICFSGNVLGFRKITFSFKYFSSRFKKNPQITKDFFMSTKENLKQLTFNVFYFQPFNVSAI